MIFALSGAACGTTRRLPTCRQRRSLYAVSFVSRTLGWAVATRARSSRYESGVWQADNVGTPLNTVTHVVPRRWMGGRRRRRVFTTMTAAHGHRLRRPQVSISRSTRCTSSIPPTAGLLVGLGPIALFNDPAWTPFPSPTSRASTPSTLHALRQRRLGLRKRRRHPARQRQRLDRRPDQSTAVAVNSTRSYRSMPVVQQRMGRGRTLPRCRPANHHALGRTRQSMADRQRRSSWVTCSLRATRSRWSLAARGWAVGSEGMILHYWMGLPAPTAATTLPNLIHRPGQRRLRPPSTDH